MKITKTNIDDIIRDEKKKLRAKNLNPSEYSIQWGKDGFNALKHFYAIIVRSNWDLPFYEAQVSDKLAHKDKGFLFLGIRHFWDGRKKGYKIIAMNSK